MVPLVLRFTLAFATTIAFLQITAVAQAQSSDQTAALQQAINALPPNGTLNCNGATYVVTSLLLKSNMAIQNCNFQTLPGSVDFAAPVTIDGRDQVLSNITIQNVSVNGNRHAQTNIGYSGQEDGGRHCFRLLGHVSQVLIENSSGTYCAGDGIALISYGVATSDNPTDLPFQNIIVRNSTFSYNRRQGGSADGINDVVFDNVVFMNNGITVPGSQEGDQCASSGGACYGTGFWYEDYITGPSGSGEGLNNLIFSRCTFHGNFQRSMFFFTRSDPAAPGYEPRGKIRILNSYLDAGAQPLAEDYALQFQVADSLVGGTPVFQNITVQNTTLDGSVGFRQTANVTIDNSQMETTIAYLGYSAYSTNIGFDGVQPADKQLAANLTPNGQDNPIVTYSSGSTYSSLNSTSLHAGGTTKGVVQRRAITVEAAPEQSK